MDTRDILRQYKLVRFIAKYIPQMKLDQYPSFLIYVRKKIDPILKQNNINPIYFMVREQKLANNSKPSEYPYNLYAHVLLFIPIESYKEDMLDLFNIPYDPTTTGLSRIKCSIKKEDQIIHHTHLELYINLITKNLDNTSRNDRNYLFSPYYGPFPLDIITSHLKLIGIVTPKAKVSSSDLNTST